MLRIATSPKGRGNCSFEVRFCKSAVFFLSDALAPPSGELARVSVTEEGRFILQQNTDQSGAAIVDDLFQRFLQAGAGFLRHVEELVLQPLIHQFMQALAKDV